MATFKFSIPEGTDLWSAVGHLPSKARNAEIYRLAATGLLMQGHEPVVKSAKPIEVSAQTVSKIITDTADDVSEHSSFMAIDLGDALMSMVNIPRN